MKRLTSAILKKIIREQTTILEYLEPENFDDLKLIIEEFCMTYIISINKLKKYANKEDIKKLTKSLKNYGFTSDSLRIYHPKTFEYHEEEIIFNFLDIEYLNNEIQDSTEGGEFFLNMLIVKLMFENFNISTSELNILEKYIKGKKWIKHALKLNTITQLKNGDLYINN